MFIEDWKLFWKFWSVRLTALGTILLALPDIIRETWQSFPPELLPDEWAKPVGLVLLIASVFARVISQPKIGK